MSSETVHRLRREKGTSDEMNDTFMPKRSKANGWMGSKDCQPASLKG
jgi:hypothetical protein